MVLAKVSRPIGYGNSKKDIEFRLRLAPFPGAIVPFRNDLKGPDQLLTLWQRTRTTPQAYYMI